MLLAQAVACSEGLFSTVLVGKSTCVEMHPCQSLVRVLELLPKRCRGNMAKRAGGRIEKHREQPEMLCSCSIYTSMRKMFRLIPLL